MRHSLYRLAKALRPSRPLQTPWDGVPEAFRSIPVGTFHLPENLAQWQNERVGIRATVLQCLGDLPPRPAPLDVRTVWKKASDDYTVEKFIFDNGVDSQVPAYLAIPKNSKQPLPAVITVHGHGGRKE